MAEFSEADKQTILTLVASILSAILSANPSLLTSLGSDRSAPAMDQDSQASDRSAMTGSAVDTAAVSMPATAPNVTPRAAVAQSQAPVPQEAQVAIPTASPAPVTTQSPAPLTQAAQVQPMAPLVQPPVGPVAIDPAAPQSSQAHRDGDDDEPNHDGDGSPVAEDRGD
ncbi:hypothetical protein QFC24_004818 [Naganishia onofrii]|uniref:Uncharacterized protein n=1 Tax=Naganishia onofrii TaxID=1851511 RepID=A0ACC2XBZ4_9TREE|nr:hypothetical protein QFC24_004818 [Naganishia onofrii]